MSQCVPSSVTFGQSNVITLTSGVDSIVLNNPEFNNVQTLAVQRVSNRNIAGDLFVYKFDKFDFINQYKIRNLTVEQIEDYLAFCDDHIGDVITLTDYNDQTWDAILTRFGEVERGDDCANTITLEFISTTHGI